MTITTPPRPLTVDEFIHEYGSREETWELVEGIPVMVPFESFENSCVAGAMAVLFHRRLGDDYLLAPHAGLHLPIGRRPTIRVPDFVLRHRTATPRDRGDTTGVVLVVEVVSDSSVADDWVFKRREYAAAGIPNYLVIDVREGAPRLWLFTGPGDDYPDPSGDGSRVVIPIDDVEFTLTAEDIADFL